MVGHHLKVCLAMLICIQRALDTVSNYLRIFMFVQEWISSAFWTMKPFVTLLGRIQNPEVDQFWILIPFGNKLTLW